MFDLTIKLTKQYILDNISEEEIFVFYGIPVTDSFLVNPFRTDKNPTCSFYRNSGGVLKFKDFSGFCNWSCFDLVMYVEKCSFGESLEHIYNKLIKKKAIKFDVKSMVNLASKSNIKVKTKDFTKSDLDYWNSYGISLKTLRHFKVYSVEYFILNQDFYFVKEMCFAYYYAKNNIKLYFPTRKKYRFIGNSEMIQGFNQIKPDEFIVVTKSMKDVMCFYELGVVAIAYQAESIILDEDTYIYLKGIYRYIIINYDWDYAGKLAMIKMKHKFPNLIFQSTKNPKDISDYYKKYGKTKTLELIENIKNELRKKLPKLQ